MRLRPIPERIEADSSTIPPVFCYGVFGCEQMRPVPTLDSSFVNRIGPTANFAYHIYLLLGKQTDVIVILGSAMRCIWPGRLSGRLVPLYSQVTQAKGPGITKPSGSR